MDHLRVKIRKIVRYFAFSISLLLALVYGVVIGRFQLPPYLTVAEFFNHYFVDEQPQIPEPAVEIPKEYTEIPVEYTETDIDGIMSIRTPEDISGRRDKLVNYLWGRPELSLALPSAIENNWQDTRYDDFPSLQKIDKITISMEFELNSIVYHFIPENPNNKIVLYHQGHRGDFFLGKDVIMKLVDNGYAVMAFAMPLVGLNNQPTIDIERIGKLKLTTHDQMKFLSPSAGHPIQYLIQPVITALNYLEKNFSYTLVSMVGISGGGWTTTLAAAADTRIKYSFPIAGSYPIYLRSDSQRDWGDYEQTAPELYQTVNYLDLYVLGAYGKNRKQIQILNQYDTCCFAGIKSDTYKTSVRTRLSELGEGEFELMLDDSHFDHVVSDYAMARVLEEIANFE